MHVNIAVRYVEDKNASVDRQHIVTKQNFKMVMDEQKPCNATLTKIRGYHNSTTDKRIPPLQSRIQHGTVFRENE